MENKALSLNKNIIKEDLKKYEDKLPKKKFNVLALVSFVLFIVTLSISAFIFYKFGSTGVIVVILAAIFFMLALFLVRRSDNIRRINYSKYMEIRLKEYANEKNMLSLSPVIPYFLKVDDETRDFKIYYNDDVIISCNYNQIKDYKIYYNGEYETKKRLPEKPIKGVKEYKLEIIFKEEGSQAIEFLNVLPPFIINDKYDYVEFVNTESINKLATLLDQILRINKK